ncbi:hypothetical protein QE320_gp189 [Pseudomonas phage EM]|uniref:Uncharacterized protein n=1 Tax=Pseudomonas phage EM TaxID=2936914 RepID=A0AAE9HGG1_9CAUD|nr:hypothetical protein QE320_gp189 [Pseudomonas phage EM]UPW35865.1 hypothetical protein EM_080 [Pseudomonas phage EM]
MTIKKAKRKLTDIKFEHEGAHIALVSKHQGGAANGHTVLITKSTDGVKEELIEKASEVTVKMQFPEFLRKFFGLYYDDAEVLSVALGYGRTEYPDYDSEKDWIDTRVESIEILKSVYRSADLDEALSELTPEQMLKVKEDQAMLEKALEVISGQVENQNPSKEITNMETILKSAHLEALADAVAIEKAAGARAVAEIQKQLDATNVELTALREIVKAAEAEKTASIAKARKEQLAAVLPADKVEDTFKSLEVLDDEAFAQTVGTLAILKAAADQNEMLDEKGVSGAGEEDDSVVAGVAAILKSRHGVK